jgi:hypothetical protein
LNGILYLGTMIVAALVGLSLLFGIVALCVTFLPAKRAANAAPSVPEDRTDSSSAASKGKLR